MFKLQFTGIEELGIKPEEITVDVQESQQSQDSQESQEFLDNIICKKDSTMDFLYMWKSLCDYHKAKKGYENDNDWEYYID